MIDRIHKIFPHHTSDLGQRKTDSISSRKIEEKHKFYFSYVDTETVLCVSATA